MMYSLPEERIVTWNENVGISGDIPVRTAIYNTLYPSGGDDTSGIQSLINNCTSGKVVKLASGLFYTVGGITMKPNITLRGDTMSTTIIWGTSIAYNALIFFRDTGWSWDLSTTTDHNISDAEKGATVITTADTHGWGVGDIVLVDMLNDTSGVPCITNYGDSGGQTWSARDSATRCGGQVVKVKSVPASNQIEIETPLYWTFDRTPQGIKMPGMLKFAGIEDLTLVNVSSGSGNQQSYGALNFGGAQHCWAYRVGVQGSYVSAIHLYETYKCQLRSCIVWDGCPPTPASGPQYASNRAYGIRMLPWNSGNLIEDCWIYHVSVGFMIQGVATGNVFAYNTVGELYYADPTWNREGLSYHAAHPMMNLWEGNQVEHDWLFTSDNIWGSASHTLLHRNKGQISPTHTAGLVNVVIAAQSQYFSLLGNEIGTGGYENQYAKEDDTSWNPSGSDKWIYYNGYWNFWITDSFDWIAVSTIIRHGNWDSVHNSYQWIAGEDQNLPESMYLSSKPSWWAGSWPRFGPTMSSTPTSSPGGISLSGLMQVLKKSDGSISLYRF